jgi:alanine dehydrogenase
VLHASGRRAAATTGDSESDEEEGVRHICIPNLPSEVGRTASRAHAYSILPYLSDLSAGLGVGLARNDALRAACGYYNGRLVARSLRRYVPYALECLDDVVPREG